MEENKSSSYIERSRSHSKESPACSVAEKIASSCESGDFLKGWGELNTYMNHIGSEEKDSEAYLLSLMLHHGNDILVRRGSLYRSLDAVEQHVPIIIQPLDEEPNASLLGNGKGDQNGIEVALTGGFGWFVDKKIAGVYGFLPQQSSISVFPIKEDSPSESKKGVGIMRRVEGAINPDDVLFFLFRTHRSAFPEKLLKDEDYDEMTGEVNPFIRRLYVKSRKT